MLGVKTGSIALAFGLCLLVVKTGSVRADDYGTPIAVSGASPLSHAWTTVSTTPIQVCPANANHRYGVSVQNTGANPIACGDANVGATQGQVLAADATGNHAGSVASFPTTGAVYCYSASGSTANCLEYPR